MTKTIYLEKNGKIILKRTEYTKIKKIEITANTVVIEVEELI